MGKLNRAINNSNTSEQARSDAEAKLKTLEGKQI
jgi:hypothetical protein